MRTEDRIPHYIACSRKRQGAAALLGKLTFLWDFDPSSMSWDVTDICSVDDDNEPDGHSYTYCCQFSEAGHIERLS